MTEAEHDTHAAMLARLFEVLRGPYLIRCWYCSHCGAKWPEALGSEHACPDNDAV